MKQQGNLFETTKVSKGMKQQGNLFEETKVSKSMKRQRIKTNIIELSKLRTEPTKWMRTLFVDGKLDVHEAFKIYGEEYPWLYENSDYDLVGWEIEQGVFDWRMHSWIIAKYCPEHFDPEKYDWQWNSWAIAKYYPQAFDSDKYNWEWHSWAVAEFCPEKLDPERYNWKKFSWAVAMYCPEKLDPERYNWAKDEWAVKKYCPEKLSLKPLQPFDKNES